MSEQPAKPINRILTDITTLAAALSLLALSLSAICSNYLCEIISFARLPLTLLAALLLAALFPQHRKRCLIMLPIFVLNLAPLAPLATHPDSTQAEKAAANEVHNVTILNFNADALNNKEYISFAEQLDRKSPDIIALEGLSRPWITMMEHGLKGYPYSCKAIEEKGVALYSRLPITNSEIHRFGRNQHPRIIATLNVSNTPITVVVANPTGPKNSVDMEERDAELDLIAKELLDSKGPKVLVGDLNCTPWSGEMAHLQAAGVYDSELGFGPQPSFPARTGRIIPKVDIPPVVPLDHILLSKHFTVTGRQAGPAIGSDHLPVTARTRLIVSHQN